MQKRTSPVKFAHLAEKSGKGSISNLSSKVERLLGSAGDGATQDATAGTDAYYELAAKGSTLKQDPTASMQSFAEGESLRFFLTPG